jgi:hypothetical protein
MDILLGTIGFVLLATLYLSPLLIRDPLRRKRELKRNHRAIERGLLSAGALVAPSLMLLVMEKSGSWDSISGAWFFPGVPLGLLLWGIMELLLRLVHALISNPREGDEGWEKPLGDGMFYAVLLSIALICFLVVAELGSMVMDPNAR